MTTSSHPCALGADPHGEAPTASGHARRIRAIRDVFRLRHAHLFRRFWDVSDSPIQPTTPARPTSKAPGVNRTEPNS